MSEILDILVLDDELGIREGCRKILTAEGYDVTTAEDGVSGLELIKGGKCFAAALVDLRMPRLNGIEFINQVQKYDANIVLFVITAYASINTAIETTKCGAYGYICKPFTPDELLLSLRNGIEKRKLIMESLRLREERENRLLEVAYERSKSNTIINCMTDGVLVVNRHKQIVLRNIVAARMVPSCADIVLPYPLENIKYFDQLKSLIIEILKVDFKYSIESKEISIGPNIYMANAGQVIDNTGNKIGVVVLLRDITTLKKLTIAKSMFVSMVAHELKSPLAAIEGYLRVILDGSCPTNNEKNKKMLKRSLVRAKNLRVMISELMNLTAIESGKFDLKRFPLNLTTEVADIVETYRQKALEKNITLNLTCNVIDLIEKVLADKDAVQRIFSNLIDNAIKYTMKNGHIIVTIEKAGIYTKVVIKDDGIGINHDELDKIFEEFYRVKNEYTTFISGTGLGLSLVKQLVELQQGKITVESIQGKGSVFTVYLPLAKFID